MELSKEVHGLLERIKKISQKSGQDDSYGAYSKNAISVSADEIDCDLIDVSFIDFTDDERWLYVSEKSLAKPYEGDLKQWLYKDFTNNTSTIEVENRNDLPKKVIDSRTFTRPKKRISRPTLDHLMHSSRLTDCFNENELEPPPVQFKLSEPAYNNSFNRILAMASDSFDSFQNMEPPSLMNSLCSSTFTNLMDSGYENQVPNDQDLNLSGSLNENFDPNITEIKNQPDLDTTYCDVKNMAEPHSGSKNNKTDSNSYLSEIKHQNTDPTYYGMKNAKVDPSPYLNEMKYQKQDPNFGFKSIKVDSYLNEMKYQRSEPNNGLNMKYEPNSTYPTENYHKIDKNCTEFKPNNQFQTVNDMNSLSKTIEQLNSTFSKSPKIDRNTFSKSGTNSPNSGHRRYDTFSKLPKSNSPDLNQTYQKNINNRVDYLSGTNTITKKSKLSNHLKASCPDINQTFQVNNEYCMNETFQKLSDSQPNLTEDLKRTILNQSMELMHPTIEPYHSARSGSADSLDERSSSISNSSKDSGTKILNLGDLESLAKMQEQSLQQVMSTPKPTQSRLKLWDGDVLSPIQNRLVEDSDSDVSDSCATTARSGLSKRSHGMHKMKLPQQRSLESIVAKPSTELNVTRPVAQKPEMIVKPMEKRTMVQPSRPQTAPPVSAAVRPRLRASGLPRPTISSTGIPRPQSRIPGPPNTFRAPGSYPNQQKTDWMDGCY